MYGSIDELYELLIADRHTNTIDELYERRETHQHHKHADTPGTGAAAGHIRKEKRKDDEHTTKA